MVRSAHHTAEVLHTKTYITLLCCQFALVLGSNLDSLQEQPLNIIPSKHTNTSQLHNCSPHQSAASGCCCCCCWPHPPLQLHLSPAGAGKPGLEVFLLVECWHMCACSHAAWSFCHHVYIHAFVSLPFFVRRRTKFSFQDEHNNASS